MLKILHILHNITMYYQVVDLHLSHPFSQLMSQLTTLALYKSCYGSFRNNITGFIDHFIDL